jgi:NRPS condensation-like uncharacterized protein
MKRKLLFLERVLYGNGTEPFHGVFSLKINGDINPDYLTGALERLQEKYPILKTCIQEDEKGDPYFITPENPLPIPVRIAQRNGDSDCIRETKRELATPFDVRQGPLLRLAWIRSEGISDLILAFHHCMCDGGSGLAMLGDILALLDNPDQSIGTSPAFDSVAELIPKEILSNKKKIFKARLSAALVHAGLKTASIFISKKTKPGPRQRDYLINWKLNAEESSLLFKICKEQNVTVNTALGLAFLNAFQAVRGDQAHGKATCPVDIRRYMPEIKRDTIFAFGLALNISLNKKAGADFWEDARNMQTKVSRQMARLNPYEFIMIMEASHSCIHLLRKFLTYGKVGNDFMFSNMGRLDIPSNYRAFNVDTIYSPTVVGPFANPNTIITTTFNGQMDFSFVSNEDFMPEKAALQIKDKAMELLLTLLPSLNPVSI